MEKNTLLNHLIERRSKSEYTVLAGKCVNDENIPSLLMDLMVKEEHPLNFRAAYLLDIIHSLSPKAIHNYYNGLIEMLFKIHSDSVKRHILKILSESDGFTPHNLVALFDYCQQIVINPKEKVAAKVHGMQVMANLCHTVPELKNELTELITHELVKNTAAFSARAKHIINQLKKV